MSTAESIVNKRCQTSFSVPRGVCCAGAVLELDSGCGAESGARDTARCNHDLKVVLGSTDLHQEVTQLVWTVY